MLRCLILFLFLSVSVVAKTYLVMNAGSGLGAAVVQKLDQPGNHLILTARTPSKAQGLCKNATQTILKLGFGDPNLQNLKITDQPIDGVVVIPARPQFRPGLFHPKKDWDKALQVSFFGPLQVLESTLPHLRTGGKIVIVGGLSSKQALKDYAHAGIIRLMWVGMAKTLSLKLAERGIHVNTIALAHTMTNHHIQRIQKHANENQKTYEEQYTEEVKNVPLKKYATPAEVANVVAFLLSKASDHITGVNLTMDGGRYPGY